MPRFERRFPFYLGALPLLLAVLLAPVGAVAVLLADAGPDQQIDCAAPGGVEVQLAGSGEDDQDPAAVLTYTWTSDSFAAPVDGATPIVTLPPGDHTLSLTVGNTVATSESDEVLISITADTEPPTIVLSQSSAEMWPPNHSYWLFRPSDFVSSVSDTCDPEAGLEDVVFAGVVSDEPENDRGDGNTTHDVLFEYGCAGALIRSERQGPGDGRVYQATLSVGDAAGNAAEAVVSVSVPKSRGHGPAVDSGDVYQVIAQSCAAVDLCPALPADDCLPAEDAKLRLRSRGDRAKLRLRARGFDADATVLGDGSDETDYQLCIYVDDGAASSISGDPAAPAGPGWRTDGSRQVYKAKGSERAAGLQKLRLRSRGSETDVRLAARGEGLDVPDLPVPEGSAVRVQLWNNEGVCMEATFDEPSVNKTGRYRAGE
jgi:hypothetical protein